MNASTCNATCKSPAPVYACNHTSALCEKAPVGHPDAASKQVCEKNCTKPKPKPPPPPPPPSFRCDNVSLSCAMVSGNASNGSAAGKYKTQAACAQDCVQKYQCAPSNNGTNLTCTKVAFSTSGALPLANCSQACKVPPTHNATPAVLKGTYRGILISGSGKPSGEWDLHLAGKTATLRNSSGVVWTANTSTGGMAPLTFHVLTPKPGVVHALYTFEPGPETTRLTLALGTLNGSAPKAYDDAMLAVSGMSVLALARCGGTAPPKPVPGGNYCDPTVKPAEMCPPLTPGKPALPCPNCADPPCLCPGHYPPPPPPPPGQADCDFSKVFPPSPPVL